jgi:integrase
MNKEQNQSQDKTSPKNKSRLSKDGKWCSFPKVPNLLQYTSSGTYFARVKINGKIIRQSLETNVWTNAKLNLVDFLKKQQGQRDNGVAFPLFSQAVERFKQDVANDASLKERSKHYRTTCIRKIELTWPDLWEKRINEITTQECKTWAAKLRAEVAGQYFNNIVDTLRLILDAAIEEHQKAGGEIIPNVAGDVARAKIKAKHLKLPEPDQFRQLVAWVRKQNSWGKAAAELIEFLAYSGLRLYTEAQWAAWEDVDRKRNEIVVRGDPNTATKNWEIRRIPILPNMAELLERLAVSREEPLNGRILRISECPGTLKKACEAVGIPPLRHHDLRHLFATRCIEAGVDIPTVARWLGHKDGGALAMRTYGHLRNEHSQAMAQKVKF